MRNIDFKYKAAYCLDKINQTMDKLKIAVTQNMYIIYEL